MFLTSRILVALNNKCQCKLIRYLNTTSATYLNRSTSLLRNKPSCSSQRSSNKSYAGVLVLSSLGVGIFYFLSRNRDNDNPDVAENLQNHKQLADLPTYTKHQVNERCNRGDVVWTTYKDGVYDLTGYATLHPGGEEMIGMAAGTALDTIWQKYKFHQKPEILQQLESMRIGNLVSAEDEKPARCKPPKVMPRINPEDYRLELVIGDQTIKSLKLEDVKRYPRHSIVSEIPCKSNKKEGEKNTTTGPTWTGARLYDVLCDLDVKTDYDRLQFECMDDSKAGSPYGSSIPVDKAKDPAFDVLLAYEMNGSDIPIESGYPIRVVMPQLAGARNVKWLTRIRLEKDRDSSASDAQPKQN